MAIQLDWDVRIFSDGMVKEHVVRLDRDCLSWLDSTHFGDFGDLQDERGMVYGNVFILAMLSTSGV